MSADLGVNGLTDVQQMEIVDINADIRELVARVEALGRHRNHALAVTKLEEAWLWLYDRLRQPPGR